ncbi:MAG: glycoside hydrolase family 88 protein [Prevotella sp.]|nr:glycoside hydrolase family 88 protein [Prevotella sp.]MDY5258842.1 glycoside hydrolase family 88 protein [Prevotella sp.]
MKHSAIANAPAKLLLAATLLLSGSANIMAQPNSSTTTSYTRYSEWMANSLYNTKDTTYHYDYSLVFEAMMDTYLTYHNDANSKLDATNVLNSVNNYITTIDGGNDYKNAYQKKDGSKSTQLDYVRPLRFYMRYHKLFPKTTLNKYDEIISNVLNHMSDGTFERLTYKDLYVKSSGLSDKYTPWEHKSTYNQQVWLDGTFMGLPFYTLAGPEQNAKKAADYFTDAANQLLWVDTLTYDSDKNLWRHAYDNTKQQGWATKKFAWPYADEEAQDKTSGRSAHAWARAMGWYAMACMEVMDNMQACNISTSDPNYQAILALFQKIMKGVVAVQNPDTYVWYQVLDANYTDKDLTNDGTTKKKADVSGIKNYLESTASAIFSYCLLKGYNKGWLDETYKEAGEAAYCGVVKQFVTDDSKSKIKLTKCCKMGSLNMAQDKGYDGSYASYIKSFEVGDNDSKGTGPFIWASLEAEKLGYVLKTNSFAPTITATGTATEGGFTSSDLWQTVTITAPKGAKIYYTTDGTEPTDKANLYTQPFNLYASATVKAVCQKDNTMSDVATSHINIYQANNWDAAKNTLVLDELATDYTPVAANGVTVTVKRALVKDKWNAVCLPFAVTAADFKPAGVTLQTFTGVRGNTFLFSNATSVEAGQPFIVKPTKDIKTLTLNKDIEETSPNSAASTCDGYTFEGTYTRKLLSPDDNLFISLATQQVVPPTGSNLLKGLRAYFIIPATASGKEFSISTDGITDRINTIETGAPDPSKPMYNLSGQRVKSGYRGIIVQNGKKYIGK